MTTEDAIQITHRVRVVELGKRYRKPVASEFGEFAQAGALMSFGPSILDQFRYAAGYIDKLFKGARPGDLPVEQATRFELVVNLKTAKALGLTIPPSVLGRADQVIERWTGARSSAGSRLGLSRPPSRSRHRSPGKVTAVGF